MNKPPGLLRVIVVTGTCAAITLALGAINIGLGILAMFVLYSVADDLLSSG